MRPALSSKRSFLLTLMGYIIIGAASNGFYQHYYFSHEGTSPFAWVAVGLAGSIVLITKNVLGDNKARAIFVDLCFVFPTVFIPFIPARHDVMLILMLAYACIFIALYVFKNYKY